MLRTKSLTALCAQVNALAIAKAGLGQTVVRVLAEQARLIGHATSFTPY
jgi:hypothetical protein